MFLRRNIGVISAARADLPAGTNQAVDTRFENAKAAAATAISCRVLIQAPPVSVKVAAFCWGKLTMIIVALNVIGISRSPDNAAGELSVVNGEHAFANFNFCILYFSQSTFEVFTIGRSLCRKDCGQQQYDICFHGVYRFESAVLAAANTARLSPYFTAASGNSILPRRW